MFNIITFAIIMMLYVALNVTSYKNSNSKRLQRLYSLFTSIAFAYLIAFPTYGVSQHWWYTLSIQMNVFVVVPAVMLSVLIAGYEKIYNWFNKTWFKGVSRKVLLFPICYSLLAIAFSSIRILL